MGKPIRLEIQCSHDSFGSELIWERFVGGIKMYPLHLQCFHSILQGFCPYSSFPKMILGWEFWWCCQKCDWFRKSEPMFSTKKMVKGPRLGSHLLSMVLSILRPRATILLIREEVGRTGNFLFKIYQSWTESIPPEVSRSSLKQHVIVFTSKSRAQQLGVQKVCQQPCVPKVSTSQKFGSQGGRKEVMKANRK